MAPWHWSSDPSLPDLGPSLHVPDPTQQAQCVQLETPGPHCACFLHFMNLWAGSHGGDSAAGWVGTRRCWPRHPSRVPTPQGSKPKWGLTCTRTWRPRPRLSETMKVMMVLRMVARNVLIPKTRAQSSLEREDAI